MSETRSKKILAHLADLDLDGLRQGPPQDEGNGLRDVTSNARHLCDGAGNCVR